eukprot:1806420-Rhodomonas_salina.1
MPHHTAPTPPRASLPTHPMPHAPACARGGGSGSGGGGYVVDFGLSAVAVCDGLGDQREVRPA